MMALYLGSNKYNIILNNKIWNSMILIKELIPNKALKTLDGDILKDVYGIYIIAKEE